MVVICEECGKVYKLDAEKLKSSMKGKASKIKCRVCEHVITIALPDEDSPDVVAGNLQQVSFQDDDAKNHMISENDIGITDDSEDAKNDETPSLKEPEQNQIITPEKKKTKKKVKKKSSGIGLRTKMFFLFLVVPLFLMIFLGGFSQYNMLKLANDITQKSTNVVKLLAEESIINKAKSVASQCSIFLSNNPDLNKDDFFYDLELKRIAIQKVGLKGFTALLEIPDLDQADEGYVFWCHPNQDNIGKSVLDVNKEALGSSYNHYKNILSPLLKGKGASGYYNWKSEKGIVKDMFMAAEPIEQTKYMIISTTFIDDFTTPIKNLEKDARKLTEDTRNINIVILTALLIIIGLSITVYGYKLSNNIGKLTDAADRISVGELDVVIEIKSQDEIGALADAISRMQDSLRFSIERLRRRR